MGPQPDSSPEGAQGSPTLRSFGRAWLIIGLLGFGLLFLAFALTGNARVDVAIPLLVVFVMLGVMWIWQGRRRRR